MSTLQKISTILDIIIFILTIVLVMYGFKKGFNIIELSINTIYFSALICKMVLDFIEKKISG